MNRDEMLAAACVKTKLVHVDEWDCDVLIRQMGVRELEKMQQLAGTVENASILVIALHVVAEPDGPLMFSLDDIDLLATKLGGYGAHHLANECLALSRLQEAPKDGAKNC